MSKHPQHKQIHGDSGDKPRSAADQVRAFRKVARELGADESDERFKETLRTLAKHKPAASKKPVKNGRQQRRP
jgi:hypothetical protein